MASQSVDAAVIQRTKDTLGKVIKKPPLTDRLLSRPPFRYLHDIVAEIMRSTGFFKGLYTPQELDAKSIQDREAKVAFLQKAIDTLSFVTGELSRVKPQKVVAGHEVEKTNEFLQSVSIAILKQLDSSEAVQRVLKGEKPSETLGRDKKKRPQRGDNEGRRGRDRKGGAEEREHSGSGTRPKPKDATKGSSDSPSLHSKSQRRLQNGTNKSDTDQKEEGLEGRGRPKHRPSRRRPQPDSDGSEAGGEQEGSAAGGGGHNHLGGEEEVDSEGPGSETRLDRPVSAKGARRRHPPPPSSSSTAEGENRTMEHSSDVPLGQDDVIAESHDSHMTANQSPSPPPPPTGLATPGKRPNTARPAPPKIVKHGTSLEDVTSRVPSGHAPTPPTVILDRPGDHEEEEEEEEEEAGQFVVEDSTPLAPPTTNSLLEDGEDSGDKPEGALTRAIVATKERLEGGLPPAEGPAHPGISEAQRRKERELVAREIEKLQSSIQTLCRSANPLGKIMDYVQEDMDSMQKELETWKTENERHAEALRKEQSITEQELSPLRAQLEELDTRIKEQVDLISTTKSNVLRNDDKIQQMLNSMAFSSS